MPFNQINGTENADPLDGTALADIIRGFGGDDVLRGLGDNDRIFGDEGDDSLNGNGGNDLLFGGDGNDTLTGGMVGDGGDGEDWLYAGGGNDLIFAHSLGADSFDHVFGGAGDDTIEYAFDPLFGVGGEIHGDVGFDSLKFSSTALNSMPGPGLRLEISGSNQGASFSSLTMVISGIEQLNITTGIGDDFIRGGAYADVINVGRGNNSVYALGGNDLMTVQTGSGSMNTINGGLGIDRLTVRHGDATNLTFVVTGTSAIDNNGSTYAGIESFNINGGDGNDYAELGAGNDRFEGGLGNDTGIGGDGNDVLLGRGGDDVLSGGNGNDNLQGSRGFDTLTGGAGEDNFRFKLLDGVTDIVTDYVSGQDRILMRSEDIGLPMQNIISGIDASLFSSVAPTTNNGQFFLEVDGADGLLIWDANGIDAGGRFEVAALIGVTSIVFSDIYLY